MKQEIWAAFIIVGGPEFFACSPRRDTDEFGFPGGKLEPGESPYDAALREAREEGFEVTDMAPEPFLVATTPAGVVAWFRAESASLLPTYKEQESLRAQFAPKECITWGPNKEAIAALGF